MRVDPFWQAWAPFAGIVFSVWVGTLYNNKRVDDATEVLRAEVGRSEARILQQLAEMEARLSSKLHDVQLRLDRMEQRIERLDEQRGLMQLRRVE